MTILITGAHGFIGKNLRVRLSENKGIKICSIGRESTDGELRKALETSDFIFHLAGINRPKTDEEYQSGNVLVTENICRLVRESRRKIPILFASSTQVEKHNPYGDSKLAAEELLIRYSKEQENPVYLFRLPNVFGKWCRPNYNSVVATFCHNVARGLPIQINDANHSIRLVYIDDVVNCFINTMMNPPAELPYCEVKPEYTIQVGELANTIIGFRESRKTLTTERVGEGLLRALYATYVSYLPVQDFSYEVPVHRDARGTFVEMIKTKDSGQMSYFTVRPGVTRGEHYHHSKSEKFLVIRGEAKFCFRNIITQEVHELSTSGQKPEIVESIPGWAHNIINTGSEELLVMLWANEVYDHNRPDTHSCPVFL